MDIKLIDQWKQKSAWVLFYHGNGNLGSYEVELPLIIKNPASVMQASPDTMRIMVFSILPDCGSSLGSAATVVEELATAAGVAVGRGVAVGLGVGLTLVVFAPLAVAVVPGAH